MYFDSYNSELNYDSQLVNGLKGIMRNVGIGKSFATVLQYCIYLYGQINDKKKINKIKLLVYFWDKPPLHDQQSEYGQQLYDQQHYTCFGNSLYCSRIPIESPQKYFFITFVILRVRTILPC